MKAEQDPVPDPISVSPPEESQNKPGHSENNNAASVPPMHASRPPSNPLGQVNAARQGKRDPSTPARPVASSMNPESRLNPDILDRLKNFNLSRQQPQRGSPNLPHTVSTGSVPASKSSDLAPNLTAARNPSSPALGGAMAARLPRRANPPMPGSAAAPTPQRPGSLAAKRAKPGLKLSDAGGSLGGAAGGPPGAGENPFSKYSEYVDAKTGTLNFKNKAILHGGGVEFSSGQTFHISLDEVDRLDELGRGNYGSVYKVRHSRPQLRKPGMGLSGIVSRPEGSKNPRPSDNDLSGAIMAMKEIRLELDESKFAQIIMELDILHRCLSPFIIDFYGAFFQEGAVYICVEYMDGGSIDNVYTNGVPENVLRKVILSTVMGLKSLKDDHNIIHRDVKPTNILVNTRGQIKICDFGVSGNLVASIAKTNIGCQSYMAPERIAGGGVQQSGAPSNGSYSVQSDVWSLGLSVIECAIGRYPYPPETFGNIFNQLHVSCALFQKKNVALFASDIS